MRKAISQIQRIRRTLVLMATTSAALLSPFPAEAQQAHLSEGCGFQHVNPDHHNGATSLYTHCADTFILIRVDTALDSYHTCVGPWGSLRFFPSNQVKFAYYVPIQPRLITTSDGRQICSTTQPPV
ncbi:DUF6355 family natural product biosynthesis protein [Saccharothrix saharensis]|uniref:DUF6355 family natural product biosynthesis protein n=1 Tax=Saccharothrix saharensis TaxID=571190 RepID=UPI003686D0E4